MTSAPRVPVGALGLILTGLIAQEVGASISVLVFPEAGPAGMVTLRLFFSAVILMLVARPRLRGIPARGWLVVTLFGVALGGMNLLFYEALARMDLGPTVTIEILGPLVLSVVLARRAIAWLWAGLALAGVVLLSNGGLEHLDMLGVIFALGAALGWAAYILASRATGSTFAGLDGLAIAMCIGAVLSLPFGVSQAGDALLRPHVLLLGLAVAVLSSAIPYALELVALRRISAETFSVVIACAPAIATLAGFVILGQSIGWLQALGIALVIAAVMGAVRLAPRAKGELEPPV